MRSAFLTLFLALLFAPSAFATVYEVKPNTQLDTISEVPWAMLQPGDTVLIHWRPEPYKEKWVICRQGTEQMPITVKGVAGPNGELPVVDGNGAVTAAGLNFASEQRGVIKIGSANVPQDTMPRYIIIDGLEIRSAHPDYQFTDDNGNTQSYTSAASSIYVEKGEHITVRNCRIHDSANGFFVASSDETVSRNILVEGNYIFGNGISGSAFQHNNYTAAIGITFQYNRFGPLRSGSNGNNLKDRSAGLVVRYNWLEGGNRSFDLVDGEDSIQIRNAPEYRKTFVYGNVLIKPDGGNNQTTHYGGDSGNTANYRKGMLYFYNNTVVSTRTGNTVIFRLSTNEDLCDARNNIFYVTNAGTSLAMLAESGVLSLANNWAKTGWRNSFESGFDGNVTGGPSFIVGTDPGFTDRAGQDFRLTGMGQAVNAGTQLHPDAMQANNVLMHYLKHQAGSPRPVDSILDIGAYEYAAAAPLQILTTRLEDAVRYRPYVQGIEVSGGSGEYQWSVSSGELPPGTFIDESTGTIAGRVRRKGSWTFTVTATDSSQAAVSKTFTINSHLYR
jgi:hypothetical protein